MLRAKIKRQRLHEESVGDWSGSWARSVRVSLSVIAAGIVPARTGQEKTADGNRAATHASLADAPMTWENFGLAWTFTVAEGLGGHCNAISRSTRYQYPGPGRYGGLHGDFRTTSAYRK